MRIGDIEFTKTLTITPTVADAPEATRVDYALGIKIRPLLVRAQVTEVGGSNFGSAADEDRVWLENGDSAAPADALAAATDPRLLPLFALGHAFVTSGGAASLMMQETNWWKLLLPRITIWTDLEVTATLVTVVLHYRFAELTDDEIVEIAAQRAQS